MILYNLFDVFEFEVGHQWKCTAGLTSEFQPRRLMIAPAADVYKRLIGRPSVSGHSPLRNLLIRLRNTSSALAPAAFKRSISVTTESSNTRIIFRPPIHSSR